MHKEISQGRLLERRHFEYQGRYRRIIFGWFLGK
jgi:hypothetical protein